jgi:phytoene dehydrogenase-like protein
MLERSIEATAEGLGRDKRAYRRLMEPLVDDYDKLMQEFLGPLRLPPGHPLAIARFGLSAIRSARGVAESRFAGERARALFAGMAAHAIMPLEKRPSAAFGLMLGILGHAVGWPVARGGSQVVANALAAYLKTLDGEIVTGAPVTALDELPAARAILLDLAPRQVLKLAGDRFPAGYRRQLEKYRYGPGVFKVDWALSEPVPWQAAACRRAGTVHLGATLPEIAASERAMWQGRHAERPYVLLAQQSLFDCSRAPQGQQALWAYCHVPSGSTFDMTGRIEAQIERFAPGFRECILARHVRTALQYESYSPNYVGGDINGGVQDFRQLFTRPAIRLNPYTTPDKQLFICSSSTPPGGGVHGMCGYYAAQAALRVLGQAAHSRRPRPMLLPGS